MGHIDLANLLLDKNAKVNCRDWYKSSPVHDAARNGHVNIVKLLLKHGAHMEATDAAGDTPLALAYQSSLKGVASALLENGARPNLVAVSKCLDSGFEDMLQLLMEYAVCDRPGFGYEPLLHTLSKRESYHGEKPLRSYLTAAIR
jgi:ankyrin repeat protein